MPLGLVSPLQMEDRILVMSGMLRGCSGNVIDVTDSSVRFSSIDDNLVCEVQVREVRKHFIPGDFVEVLEGPERGAAGFVVEANDISLAVYIRVVTMLWRSKDDVTPIEQEGREVGILIV
jgi:ribosomal protein L24